MIFTSLMRRGVSCITVCIIVTFVATVPLYAQYRASLQGTVTDPSGAAVPAATVTLTSEETGISHRVTTSNSGVYSITSLAPGKYDLTAEKTGFTQSQMTGVQITSEQAQSQNIQLSIAQPTAQTVTVSAAPPALNTETGTLSGTLSGQQIMSLPTFGSDPFKAVVLAPGTFGDNARSGSGDSAQNLPGNAGPGGTSGSGGIFQTENQVQAVADGQRTENNDFQIDGVEVNSLAWGGAAVITPNELSVKEVTVQSNSYDAAYGRNSGAQVLTVTQNGTNQFHGDALIKWDRPQFNAYQRWNGPNGAPVQRDTARFNQYDGALGGPIIRNHLFFFFSYQTVLDHSLSIGQNWYETPQFTSTVTSAVPNSIASKILGYPGEGASYNYIIPEPCSFAGLSAAQCQPVTINGQYAGLDVGSPLKLPLGVPDPGYLSPGSPGIGGGLDGIPDVMYVQTVNPYQQFPQQYNGRLDFQATSRDLLTFTTYYVPVTTTNYNGPVRAANLWHNDRLNEDGTLLWNHTISPSWLNEARFSVTRWHWNEVGSNPQEPFGLPQDYVDNFAGVNIHDQYLGPPGPSIFNQTTYNIRDTVSTMIGSHSIKFGPDIYKEQDNDSEAYSARPSYSFRNIWDLANDAPYAESGNFDPFTGRPTSATKYIRSAIWAAFIQDDWKVRTNLTLNLGLRWEYFAPVSEKYGNISNVILGSGPDPLLGLRLKVGGNLYRPDYKNIAPQFGFAWTPPNTQRFVVRGGFGIGYNRMEEAITLNGRANPPLVEGLNLTGSNVLYQIPSDVHQFSGWPVNPAAVTPFSPTTGLPVTGAPVSLNAFPQNMPTPRTYRYSLETGWQFVKDWVARVGYQGSLSRHLTVQNNLNFMYFPLNPMVQNLYWYYNGANSSYNAMLVEVQHQFSEQFQFDFQYRWSHTIDEGSNSYFIGEYPYNLGLQRGNADFDVRQNVKLYGVWSPHIFPKNSWGDKIAGGWTVTGIMNWHTGFPWTPLYENYGCNIVYVNSGYCNLRPAGLLRSPGTSESNSAFESGPNTNFNGGALAYFAVPNYTPASGSLANAGPPPAPQVGRNTLIGPRYFTTDMTLEKAFGLPKLPLFGENARIVARANFYNIFNTLNLNPTQISNVISFDGLTGNPQFGQAGSALGGRVIEFEARFQF